MNLNILLALLFLLASNFSIAQIEKGFWVVGGSGNYYNEHATGGGANIETTVATLNPSLGYLFIENLVVGLKTSISKIKQDAGFGNNVKSLDYGAGPFARYYLLNKDKQYNFLVEGHFILGGNRRNGEAAGGWNQYSFMAGPVFFFNPHIGLGLNGGYKATSSDNGSKSRGLNLELGFHIHLTNTE